MRMQAAHRHVAHSQRDTDDYAGNFWPLALQHPSTQPCNSWCTLPTMQSAQKQGIAACQQKKVQTSHAKLLCLQQQA
jgi:hypothetical protein